MFAVKAMQIETYFVWELNVKKSVIMLTNKTRRDNHKHHENTVGCTKVKTQSGAQRWKHQGVNKDENTMGFTKTKREDFQMKTPRDAERWTYREAQNDENSTWRTRTKIQEEKNRKGDTAASGKEGGREREGETCNGRQLWRIPIIIRNRKIMTQFYRPSYF